MSQEAMKESEIVLKESTTGSLLKETALPRINLSTNNAQFQNDLRNARALLQEKADPSQLETKEAGNLATEISPGLLPEQALLQKESPATKTAAGSPPEPNRSQREAQLSKEDRKVIRRRPKDSTGKGRL